MKNLDKQYQDLSLPDQPLSELENLEYLYTMYKRTVERGKPNQRMAEQLKTYIDIIQVKVYE
jgi:hypothetical protein